MQAITRDLALQMREPPPRKARPPPMFSCRGKPVLISRLFQQTARRFLPKFIDDWLRQGAETQQLII
jgi:hypothetical protein